MKPQYLSKLANCEGSSEGRMSTLDQLKFSGYSSGLSGLTKCHSL